MVQRKVRGMLTDFIRGGARGQRRGMSEKTAPKDCVHRQSGRVTAIF